MECDANEQRKREEKRGAKKGEEAKRSKRERKKKTRDEGSDRVQYARERQREKGKLDDASYVHGEEVLQRESHGSSISRRIECG
jgi:hypothetical protein